MKTNIFTRIAALGALLLSAAACVFPYEVDLEQNGDAPLVVEGDIHIGGTTRILLSRLSPIDAVSQGSLSYGSYYDSYAAPGPHINPFGWAQGTIVGEDGTSVGSWLDRYNDKVELVSTPADSGRTSATGSISRSATPKAQRPAFTRQTGSPSMQRRSSTR